ncbi:type III-A CRISPR-associated protein Csm2 [Helicobacter cetorum]|uniref:CRISPR system Cms protein Csm2 n=1 Tax=Helicobacter cetorum (strain ATCC BAA-429 / MIT 00-7128) TaxID=182217 RepID=I0EP16_HELC0|nr:type III-A CRISPR-associated protein Csm2 [Helicobacter cetorum]AFI04685.1 CRISPR-associated protein, Csm2 family [Helicobacter cetorum MIT 00-7128]
MPNKNQNNNRHHHNNNNNNKGHNQDKSPKQELDKEKFSKSEHFKFDLTAEKLKPTIFSDIAKNWSLMIANYDKGVKSSQLRLFYNEALKLEQEIIKNEDNFEKVLPFINALKFKVFYAKRRGLVNEALVIFIEQSLSQINHNQNEGSQNKDENTCKDNKEVFKNFLYLFEAIIGFYDDSNEAKNETENLKESCLKAFKEASNTKDPSQNYQDKNLLME